MKIIYCLLLPASLLIAACPGKPTNSEIPKCVTQDHFTITPPSAALDAAPPHICVERGTTITVTVAGNRKKGSVATSPKVSTDTWLYGSNAADGKIFYLYVNNDASLGEHKFIISTQDGKVKDPRVTVVNQN